MWNHSGLRGESVIVTGLADASDEELMERASRGEEAAFTALYRRRQGALYRFALRMSGNRAIAEEVVQETFLAVIRGGWEPARGPVAGWLFGIARNQTLRSIERDGRYVAAEDGEALRRALLSLPAHYREAAVLCDIEEMSYAEAARVIGCPVGTLRSRLSRARDMLAEKMRARMGCSR
jgi:RNA polymerase sigma-70 factor (ECF subfamily)